MRKNVEIACAFVKNRWQWCLIIFVTFLLMINHVYSDFYATMRHGMCMWDALFEGRLLEFYSYCAEGGPGFEWGNEVYNGTCKAYYDVGIYLVFAIWNLPCWIFEKITGCNAQMNLICMIYAKMMIVTVTSIAAIYVDKIWKIIDNKSDDNYVMMHFLSSILLIMYTSYTGNYDIVGILFMLIGVYYFILDNEKKFILFFSIAVALKYFALLPFILLVLLKEKNIIKIVLKLISGISLVVAGKIIFSFSNNNVESLPGVGIPGTKEAFISQILPIGVGGEISIFAALILVLCIIAYGWDKDDNSSMWYRAIYLCFASYMCFIIFCYPNPYWVVILLPFSSLLVVVNRNSVKINLLLEIIFSFSLLAYNCMRFGWVISGKTASGMFIDSIISKNNDFYSSEIDVGDILLYMQNIYDIELLFSTFATMSAVMLLILTFPGKKSMQISDLKKDRELINIINYRVIFMCGVALIPTMLHIVQLIVR